MNAVSFVDSVRDTFLVTHPVRELSYGDLFTAILVLVGLFTFASIAYHAIRGPRR